MFDEKKYIKDYKKKNYKRVALDLPMNLYDEFRDVLNKKNEKAQTVIKNLITEYIQK